MKKTCFLTILFLIFTLICFGQTDIDLVIDRQVHFGNLLYPLTLDGSKDFLFDIMDDQLEIYEKLFPFIDNFESKNSLAIGISISLGIAGLGCIGAGSYFLYDLVENNKDNHFLPISFIIPGVLLLSGAIPIYFLISPNENDFIRFYNRYNKLNPDNPVEIY